MNMRSDDCHIWIFSFPGEGKAFCLAPFCRRLLLLWTIVSLAAFILGLSKKAEGSEIILADGRRLVGELVSASVDGRLEFLANLEPLEVRTNELIVWGRLSDIQAPIIVVLADGSLVASTAIRIADEQAFVRGIQAPEFILPVDTLAGVLLLPPGDRERKDLLIDQVLQGSAKSDEVLLLNGDRIAGMLVRLDERTCLMEIPGGTAPVPQENVVAIIFQRELRARVSQPITAESGQNAVPANGPVLVGLLDGSIILCRSVETSERALQLTLALGPVVAAKVGTVVFILPLQGAAVYLSDLAPVRYEHRPFLGISRPLGKDRSVLGTRLRKGGRIFPKGLGMQSWASVKYRLDGKFQRFEAAVAIDDVAGDAGSVEFVVVVDGREIFRSGIIRGNDPLRPVSVDTRGAAELELVVEYADRAHEGDYADWLLARLIPMPQSPPAKSQEDKK